MTVDLRTCVPEQLVELRNGNIVRYTGRNRNQDTLYPHIVGTFSYTDDGYYYATRKEDVDDVVRILPMAKPEPPESDTHPSVAWWESCPWITDRRPTAEDADHLGQVIQQVLSEKGETLDLCFMSCAYVKEGEAWIHSLKWKPLKQTPKEKALALVAKHRAGWDINDNWIPTPDDWNVIREGLAE